MPTSYTSNLRLSNPGLGDTGWGSTVSNGMIDLVDPAIAGTTTLSADTDVILTTANGMADQARQMILNCTGSRAAQRTITAPASSKVYVVINGTTGGFGVKIVGVGPTTGVVVPAGRMAVVAWNGSDFVTLGAVVDLHVAGQTRIQDSASASNYILIGSGTNAPRGGNSVMAQTGSMVMGTEAASSLFFVTNAATAMTLDASGNLGLGVTPSAWQSAYEALEVGNSLGIIGGSNAADLLYNAFINSSGNPIYRATDTASYYSLAQGKHRWGVAPSGTAGNAISFTQAMTLDASGNLGVGTNSPGGSSTARQLTLFGTTSQFSAQVGAFTASFGNNATIGYVEVTGANPLAFFTNATERARFTAVGDFIHQVNGTAPTLSTNSTMSFELTSNTSLKVVVRGTDGVTRSVSLTLS